MEYLKIKNWDKWQTYRADRGQPPWIKIHRCVMRNPEWVSLSDAEKGQLVSLWMLGADKNGLIPSDPNIVKRLCFLEFKPDLNKFLDLEFLCQNGVNDTEDDGQDEQDEQDEQGEGKIYFIEYEGSIKIGFSKNPWARLNSLKVGMPNEPKLISHFGGTKEIEKQLHKLFESVRINREWYKPHPYLIELTTCGLPDVIPETLTRTTCGLPDQPKAEKTRLDKTRLEKDKDPFSLSFEKFWKAYPKKNKKPLAFKAWKKGSQNIPDIQVILDALKNQKEWRKKKQNSNQFCAEWQDPERWIQNHRWEDEPEEKPEVDETILDRGPF